MAEAKIVQVKDVFRKVDEENDLYENVKPLLVSAQHDDKHYNETVVPAGALWMLDRDKGDMHLHVSVGNYNINIILHLLDPDLEFIDEDDRFVVGF